MNCHKHSQAFLVCPMSLEVGGSEHLALADARNGIKVKPEVMVELEPLLCYDFKMRTHGQTFLCREKNKTYPAYICYRMLPLNCYQSEVMVELEPLLCYEFKMRTHGQTFLCREKNKTYPAYICYRILPLNCYQYANGACSITLNL